MSKLRRSLAFQAFAGALVAGCGGSDIAPQPLTNGGGQGPVGGATEPGVKTETGATTAETGGTTTGGTTSGASSGSAAGPTLDVDVEPEGSSSSGALASLRPLQDDETMVSLTLSGSAPGNPVALIHSGSCDDLGDPVYTLTTGRGGASRTRVRATFDSLRAGGYAIALHPSPQSVGTTMACGDITSDDER